MPQTYNPIIRTFTRLRAALVAAGLPRHRLRPGAELERILPPEHRRHVLRELRELGVPVPALALPDRARRLWGWAVILAAAALAVWLQSGWALLLVVPLGVYAFVVSRPWAVEFTAGLRTLGELALYLTDFAEHRRSGYRWTRNEIAFKVRMVVAEALNRKLRAVRLKSTFRELGAC